MSLEQYITENHGGSKAAFARDLGVNRQQVTKWINNGWIVIDHVLYSPRRTISEKNDKIINQGDIK